MTTLFISDLHLCAERPHISGLFLQFLQQRAANTEALYILGDLLEYWIGDEAMDMPQHAPIVQGLKALTANGVPVSIMHGNRDFLMREGFEAMTGCQLLEEEVVIDLYGTPTLLMHGDTLCTDDLAYQQFRAMVRDPQWQSELLGKTPAERLALARQYREISKTETQGKQAEIMDVNQRAVEQAMQKHHVQQLIHGHTHRPAVHEFRLGGQPARRTVLADWYQTGSMLLCDAGACRLEEFD